MLATGSIEADWSDNVTLAQSGSSGDFILRPELDLTGSYALTDRNLLKLSLGIGYIEYLHHSELSTLNITAGSGPSFNFGVGPFMFNIHDSISYIQDSSQNPLIAGTGEFGTLRNRSGIIVSHDFGRLSDSLGFDYILNESTTGEFNSQDSGTESLIDQLSYAFSSSFKSGAELGASFLEYDQPILNNNESYNAGVFADWKPDPAFQLQPRVGYAVYDFQNTSRSSFVPNESQGNVNPVAVPSSMPIQTSGLSSWYANLSLTHQVTKSIGYTLKAGHDISAGLQSDAVEEWFVDATVRWAILGKLNFSTGISYNYGTQGVGNVRGNLTESYDWVGASFSTSYSITKRFDAGVNVRSSVRSSSQGGRDYSQDVFGIRLTYHAS